jgi:hypothetical protein
MYREIRDYNVVLGPCNPFYIGQSKCLLFPNYTEMVGKANATEALFDKAFAHLAAMPRGAAE